MKKKLKACFEKLSNTQGFTLVELMIVVAIIGILASIAIPNYQKFQAKARQSEAKLKLAGLYTAEKSYQVESTTYSGCFTGIGYAVEGKQAFYTIGFTDAVATASSCGPGATSACANIYQGGDSTGVTCPALDAAVTTAFPGSTTNLYTSTAGAGGPKTTNLSALSSTLNLSSFTFKAGATGQIGAKNTGGTAELVDRWTVDQDKTVFNENPGKAF